MQAGAAELALLDEGDGHPQLARAQRGCVATAPSAENHEVKVCSDNPSNSL